MKHDPSFRSLRGGNLLIHAKVKAKLEVWDSAKGDRPMPTGSLFVMSEPEVVIDPRWRYIEHLGDLYMGFTRPWPEAVWNRRDKRWYKYEETGGKPIEWGEIITEEEAKRIMGEP